MNNKQYISILTATPASVIENYYKYKCLDESVEYKSRYLFFHDILVNSQLMYLGKSIEDLTLIKTDKKYLENYIKASNLLNGVKSKTSINLGEVTLSYIEKKNYDKIIFDDILFDFSKHKDVLICYDYNTFEKFYCSFNDSGVYSIPQGEYLTLKYVGVEADQVFLFDQVHKFADQNNIKLSGEFYQITNKLGNEFSYTIYFGKKNELTEEYAFEFNEKFVIDEKYNKFMENFDPKKLILNNFSDVKMTLNNLSIFNTEFTGDNLQIKISKYSKLDNICKLALEIEDKDDFTFLDITIIKNIESTEVEVCESIKLKSNIKKMMMRIIKKKPKYSELIKRGFND